MTRLEKHYRIQHLAERIRQLQSEVIVLQDEIPAAGHHPIYVAGIHLAKAAEELERTVVLDLETALQLSIETVEDQKRCQQVGGILPFEKKIL